MPSSRPGAHPAPPADLCDLQPAIVGNAGPWIRIHRTTHSPLYFGRSGDSRFGAPAGEYGVLYVGSDAHCAFIETFGQSTGDNTVTTTALAERSLSRIEANRPLRLVDLTGSGLARIGADERLCAGDHRIAQRWALALWQHPAAPDGLLYRARHDPSRYCVAIFDRAEPAIRTVLLGGMLAAEQISLVGNILDTFGFGLV